ncbi:hypothetical protein [Rhodococcus opacus]|uniref:hypothetical protein n=1 Tax=Rhodococcus opacus TaxID=37919 RepID=UPI001C476E26|nr:hypothetical protein [Rhodococcus opacus]MBV6756720.1 hypothetical protein [Rhodococcus opacus]
MITTLFRTLATPLAVFLDHLMAPRQAQAFVDLSEELADETFDRRDTKVAI